MAWLEHRMRQPTATRCSPSAPKSNITVSLRLKVGAAPARVVQHRSVLGLIASLQSKAADCRDGWPLLPSAPSARMDDEQLARQLQDEEVAAGAAGTSEQPTEERKVEFLRAVNHGIFKAVSVEDKELLRYAASVMPLQQLREAAAKQLALQQQLQPLPDDPPQSFHNTSAVAPGAAAPAGAAPAAAAAAGSGKRGDLPQLGVEDLLVKGLLSWFKNSFFTWMNSPPCRGCGSTDLHYVGMLPGTEEEQSWGATRVEGHDCRQCQLVTRFPRYNDPRKLLETRTGRCGEWSHTFLLLLRAAGLEARHVQDWSDHVWTEYYSPSLRRWVHTDACEAAWDTPLLYEGGWGKQQDYVVASGRGGVADVTRRYTADFAAAAPRRTLVPEAWLVEQFGALGQRLRARLEPEVVRAAVARDLSEQLQLLTLGGGGGQAAGPLPGRQSGAAEWRTARGEAGATAPKPPTLWSLSGDTGLPALFHAAGRVVGGACRASGECGSTEVPPVLFDSRLGTKWLDFGAGGESGWAWAQYQLLQGQAPMVVTHYDIISANDCPERDPTNWRLEGWAPTLPAAAAAAAAAASSSTQEGGSIQQTTQQQGRWVVLHEAQDVSWSGRHQLRSFFIPAGSHLPCSCWRLVIGRTAQPATANSVQLCCWSMYAPAQQKQRQQQQPDLATAAPGPPAVAEAVNGRSAETASDLAAAAALPYMDSARAMALHAMVQPQPQEQGAAAATPAGPDGAEGPCRAASPLSGPLELLKRILTNLQQHPEEDKYCRVKAAKVGELLGCATCSAALLAAGFRPVLLEGTSGELALCYDRQAQQNRAAVSVLLRLLNGA